MKVHLTEQSVTLLSMFRRKFSSPTFDPGLKVYLNSFLQIAAAQPMKIAESLREFSESENLLTDVTKAYGLNARCERIIENLKKIIQKPNIDSSSFVNLVIEEIGSRPEKYDAVRRILDILVSPEGSENNEQLLFALPNEIYEDCANRCPDGKVKSFIEDSFRNLKDEGVSKLIDRAKRNRDASRAIRGIELNGFRFLNITTDAETKSRICSAVSPTEKLDEVIVALVVSLMKDSEAAFRQV